MATCSQAAGGIGSHHASGNLADISSDPVASSIFKRKPCLICLEMVLPRRSLASMMHDSDTNCIVMYCIVFIYSYINMLIYMFDSVILLLTKSSLSLRAVAHIIFIYLCLLVCPFSRDHICIRGSAGFSVAHWNCQDVIWLKKHRWHTFLVFPNSCTTPLD